MPKVIGVKFKKSCRTYYFEVGEESYCENESVIVETAKGTEIATVCMLPTEISEEQLVSPLKPVERKATAKDMEQVEKLAKKREEALKIAGEKIAESKLDMKLTDCEYSFDGNKLVIYFTAENRVDFRELVKELASVFHVRIELRQIGARDECKMLGGLGPCGRPCCCANHMSDYAHVTIKMAKNQNLSLNPAKISGLCGRLMCCLSYENEVYVEQNKKMPQMGHFVTTSDGKSGIVVSLAPLKEKVRIRMTDGDKTEYVEISASEIETSGKPDNSQRNKPQKTEEVSETGDSEKKQEKKFYGKCRENREGDVREKGDNRNEHRESGEKKEGKEKRPFNRNNGNREQSDNRNENRKDRPQKDKPFDRNRGEQNPQKNEGNREGKKQDKFRHRPRGDKKNRENGNPNESGAKKESSAPKKSE